ncbi:MAG: YqgE/AlgH family protein [Pseudomonadota bacterium]
MFSNKDTIKGAGNSDGYLDGQVLIAMPHMTDPRFKRALVFICAHSEDGAMGIVLNQLAASVAFEDLLVQLEILPEGDDIKLPDHVRSMRVHQGGPVETGRGFVLHSHDYYRDNSTLAIDDEISLTATLDILRAIAEDTGPERAVLALGYAGWAAGQLETEIQSNGWLHCTPDDDLIFGEDQDAKYAAALGKLGVDLAMLTTEAGRA